MKTKRNIRIFSVACLSILMAFATVFGIFYKKPTETARAQIMESTIENEYTLGEVLSIPQTVQVQAENSATPFTATFKGLLLPNGSAVVGNEHTLNAVGNYSLVYEYSIGNDKKEISQTFRVAPSAWTEESSLTSATPGTLRDIKINGTSAQGLNVTLGRDTFSYSQPINVHGEGLTTILTYFPDQIHEKMKQRVHGGPVIHDVSTITVSLVDCYDSTIKLDLNLWFSPDEGGGYYAHTTATGQGTMGLHDNDGAGAAKNSTSQVVIDGKDYSLFVGGVGQGMTWVSGYNEEGKFNRSAITWSYDEARARVYLSVHDLNGNVCVTRLIADLRNTEISSNVFPGFTTGEVYLSISGTEFLNDSTNIQISQIGNMKTTNLINAEYEDTLEPTIEVDLGAATGALFVEKGKEFTVFDAKVHDVNYSGKPKCNVYYNYGSDLQSVVALKDGKFTPTTEGLYTIEYSAVDTFGNVGKKCIHLTVVDETVASFSTDLPKTVTAGIPVDVSCQATSLNGDVWIETQITAPDGEVSSMDMATGKFVATQIGTYKVTFVYKDKIRSYTKEISVVSQANPDYGFIESPILENAYIKNAEYEIEPLSGYRFGVGAPNATQTKVYAKFDGGSWNEVSDLSAFKITGSKTVQFKYAVVEDEEDCYISEEIAIVDVGYGSDAGIAMEKYFQGKFTATATKDDVQYVSKVNSGSNTLTYVKTIMPQVFFMEYYLPTDAVAMDSYTFVFSDHSGKEMEVKHFLSGGVLYVEINGNSYRLDGTFTDGLKRQISYDAAKGAFEFYDGTNTNTIAYEIGKTMGACQLSIRFDGISGQAGICLRQLLKQRLTNKTVDNARPDMYYVQEDGYLEANSKATLFPAVASDALSTILGKNFTASVTAPDGSFVTADDGTLLKGVPVDKSYAYTLSQYGSYIVAYEAKDSANCTEKSSYIVNSVDVTPPSVSFEDPATQTMRVGYKYDVKKFTVKDNLSATEDVTVYTMLYAENGILLAKNFETITLTETGKYTVCVYVIDEEGNYAYASYQIVAVAESQNE